MDRWVCKRCFASNEGDASVCASCGLERGVVPPPSEVRLPVSAQARPRAWWRPLLRYWWIAGLVVVGGVGYLTQAHRDSSGAIQTGGKVQISDLRIGDCYDAPGQGEVSEVTGRPCTQSHEYELIAKVDDTQDTTYPTETQFQDFVGQACLPMFEAWVGISFDQSALQIAWVEPSSDGWSRGDRTVFCSAYDPANSKLTSSLKNARR